MQSPSYFVLEILIILETLKDLLVDLTFVSIAETTISLLVG